MDMILMTGERSRSSSRIQAIASLLRITGLTEKDALDTNANLLLGKFLYNHVSTFNGFYGKPTSLKEGHAHQRLTARFMHQYRPVLAMPEYQCAINFKNTYAAGMIGCSSAIKSQSEFSNG